MNLADLSSSHISLESFDHHSGNRAELLVHRDAPEGFVRAADLLARNVNPFTDEGYLKSPLFAKGANTSDSFWLRALYNVIDQTIIVNAEPRRESAVVLKLVSVGIEDSDGTTCEETMSCDAKAPISSFGEYVLELVTAGFASLEQQHAVAE